MPPVPSKLVDVEVATSARRTAARVALTRRVDGVDGAEGVDGAQPAVVLLDGSPLPQEWRPAGRISGKAGEVHGLPAAGDRPRWLLGIGSAHTDIAGWRTAGAALVRAANADLTARRDDPRRPPSTVQVDIPAEVDPECVAAFAIGLRLGGYRFAVTSDKPDPTVRTVQLVVAEEDVDAHVAAAEHAGHLSEATALARDLTNAPSNVKNPAWLATTAQRVCAGITGLRVEVRDARWLADQGFGGVLAVGGGSASPPRLIEMRYRPRGATRHLLLVGKGITFDTGGISLKPADNMHLMRTDMAGGGAVIAAMRAIAASRLPVRVTALVPAAENHVSGTAYRPGDVVTHYGGTTSEIGNTDAEGRIVLADALAYGTRRFRPDAVVDVATLTGAMKVALGTRTGGLFANDDVLADQLLDAADSVGERLWRMPLADAYAGAVVGERADVRQTPDGPAGITAALFLREFTDGVPWAHLDVAGPARADSTYDEVTTGGTGFAARSLVAFAAADVAV